MLSIQNVCETMELILQLFTILVVWRFGIYLFLFFPFMRKNMESLIRYYNDNFYKRNSLQMICDTKTDIEHRLQIIGTNHIGKTWVTLKPSESTLSSTWYRTPQIQVNFSLRYSYGIHFSSCIRVLHYCQCFPRFVYDWSSYFFYFKL